MFHTQLDRRRFLGLAGTGAALAFAPPSFARLGARWKAVEQLALQGCYRLDMEGYSCLLPVHPCQPCVEE